MVYFISIILIVLFYFLGCYIQKVFRIPSKSDIYYQTFINVMVGLITSVVIFAAIATKGNTIMTAFVIIGLLYLYNKHKTKTFESKINWRFSLSELKSLLLLVGICTVFVLCYYYLFYGRAENLLPHGDFIVYSLSAYNCFTNGVESLSYLMASLGVSPYHYFDLWLISLCAELGSVLYLKSELLIVFPLLASLFSFSMICIARRVTKNKVAIILSAFVGFISFPLLDYSPISQTLSANLSPKTLISGLLLTWSLLMILDKSRNWYLSIIAMPIINIVFAPLIFSTIVIISIIQLIRKKEKQFYCTLIISSCSIAIFILLFYLINSLSIQHYGQVDFDVISFFKTCYIENLSFNYLYRQLIPYVMYVPYFIPFTVILFTKERMHVVSVFKSNLHIIIFLLTSILLGVLITFAFYPMNQYDCDQLSYNFTILFLNIFTVYFYLSVINILVRKNLKGFLLISMFCIVAYNVIIATETIKTKSNTTIDTNEFVQMKDFVKYMKENGVFPLGAKISPEVKEVYYRTVSGYYDLSRFSLIIDGMSLTNLNTLSKLKKEEAFGVFSFNEDIKNNPFRNYYYKNLNRFKNVSIDTIQYNYIIDNNIDYVVFTHNMKIPDIFESIVDTVFPYGRENDLKFVFFNKPKVQTILKEKY